MSKAKSRVGLYAIIAIVVIVIVVVGVAIALMNQPGNGAPLTLYAGEVNSAAYGFGDSSTTIATAPNAPTLHLKVGTTYTMTVKNVGAMPHAWEISSQKAAGSALFGAQIASTSFLAPGASGSVTFTPNQAGNFYYICPVPGHIALGMWGNVEVTS
jgi:uncharacterized cupredoxin-like copper-binding protein